MQKVVREAEYFKQITHEQIDKKLKFMEMAVSGFAPVAEDDDDERDDGAGLGDHALPPGAIYE